MFDNGSIISHIFASTLYSSLCAGPKCGTHVTFRHGDFDENTFYCAACSGWFTVNPATTISAENNNNNGDTTTTTSSSSNGYPNYDAMLEKTVSIPPRQNESTGVDPQILMRHVPVLNSKQNNNNNNNEPKIYTTRQQQGTDHNNEQNQQHQQQQMTADPSFGQGGSAQDGTRQQHLHDIKKMPTPREIMNKLNDFVIGQKEVKVALSVGVYNHYKRIFLAEAQALNELKRAEGDGSGFHAPPPPLAGTYRGPTLQELNLGQFGTEPMKEPHASKHNSIDDNAFARDVEHCEIDKSNILLLGPTGSGKVSESSLI
jgi:hypothetical protein